MIEQPLVQLLLLLGAAVGAVTAFHRLKIPPVLGYLLEHFQWSTEVIGNNINLVQFGLTATLDDIRSHFTSMSFFFRSLLLQPGSHAVITFFLHIERHCQIKVGRPHLSRNLLINCIL